MMLQNIGLLFFRVAVSVMMLAHGWPKLMSFSSKAASFPGFLGLNSSISLGLAVFAEVFCSLFLILGLFTRWASIPLMITMLVAWYFHGVAWADPWMKQEKAVLYLVCYISIFLLGGGSWSLDKKICSSTHKK